MKAAGTCLADQLISQDSPSKCPSEEREGKVTMISTPQRQLESGVDAPGPRVAEHRDLAKHIV